MLSQSENYKKYSEQLPSREEIVSRLDIHAKQIEEKLKNLKIESTPIKTFKGFKETQEALMKRIEISILDF